MAYDRRALTGVGGWLAFFVVTLGLSALGAFFAPFKGMSPDYAARFGGNWTLYMTLTWVLCIGRACAYLFAAWLLNARQVPSTPIRVIQLLWAVAILPGLIDAVIGGYLLGVDPTEAGRAFGGAIVRSALFAAIWTAYLLRSQRVANTYAPGTSGQEELAAVFE